MIKLSKIIIYVFLSLVVFGCSDVDTNKASGNLKNTVFKKAADKLVLDTVSMKVVIKTPNGLFEKAVQKSILINSFAPILIHCDSTIMFFLITSEETQSFFARSESVVETLNDMLSGAKVDSVSFYRYDEKMENGSTLYTLAFDVSYDVGSTRMVVGFTLLNDRIKSIYLY